MMLFNAQWDEKTHFMLTYAGKGAGVEDLFYTGTPGVDNKVPG